MKVETTDLAALRKALGDEVLCGLLRLFVWVDRISSLIHFGYWSEQSLPRDSHASARNMQALVWFISGALYEATEAIAQVEKGGITGHLRSPDHWKELQEMAERWTGRVLRRGRNNLGFHVDPNVMRRGIEKLTDGGETVTVLASDDATTTRSYFRLGSEALLIGTDLALADFERIAESIAGDMGRFRELVQIVLIEALEFHEAWSR